MLVSGFKFKLLTARTFQLIGGLGLGLNNVLFASLFADRRFDLTIGTARLGAKFGDVVGAIGEKWVDAEMF